MKMTCYTRAIITGPRAKSLPDFLYLKTSSVNEALRKPRTFATKYHYWIN